MTKITGVYKTYDYIQNEMVHTGYFVTSNNYPMKYATKWQWQSVKKSHLIIYIDRILQSLKNAQ